MSPWSQQRRQLFRKPDGSGGQRSRCRPVVECLEGRMLLSGGYAQVNLASDLPGLARITDSSLVDPWGIAYSPTGPFWFAGNGKRVSALLDGRGRPLPLLVTVPPAAPSGGTPTGTVFNGGPGFLVSENGVSAPSRFLFATEDGTISGWTAVVDWTHALLAVDNSSGGAVYKGLALATDPAGRSFLYAADFGRGSIDVFDQNFKPVDRVGAFLDPSIPDGFAPFDIQNIRDLLFVTYAQRDDDGVDDRAGAGHGFVDVYDTGGNLVRRFASQGPLNSPWGIALAPAGFGSFGGALLVGNNGDGHINAYDPESGAFLGTLAGDDGIPVTIAGLWALRFGNGHLGGAADTLFFTAGVDNEAHGLFGAIQAPQGKGVDTAGPGPFDPHAPGEPGDYPLPPTTGPAFLDRDDGSDLASAVLLPMRQSSLVLIPTLVTVTAPMGRTDALLSAAPVGSGFLQVSIGTAPLVAGSASFATLHVNAPVPKGTLNNSLAVSAFLNLIIAPESCENPAQGMRLESSADPGDACPSPSTTRDFQAAFHLGGSQIAYSTIAPYTRSTQESFPPSRQAKVLPPPVPPAGLPASVADREPRSNAAQTDDANSWTELFNPLLVVASIPVICMTWHRPPTRFHRLRSEASVWRCLLQKTWQKSCWRRRHP